MIPDDIKHFISCKFIDSEHEEALSLLETATIHDGSAAEERLLRCAVVSSGGSIGRLRIQIETLKHDYRDVIVEGEYIVSDKKLVRVRNLNEPIPYDDAT